MVYKNCGDCFVSTSSILAIEARRFRNFSRAAILNFVLSSPRTIIDPKMNFKNFIYAAAAVLIVNVTFAQTTVRCDRTNPKLVVLDQAGTQAFKIGQQTLVRFSIGCAELEKYVYLRSDKAE